MAGSHKTSVLVPLPPAAGRLMFEASRRAEAMGLVAPQPPGSAGAADLGAVRRLAGQLRQAGIATAASAALTICGSPGSFARASSCG